VLNNGFFLERLQRRGNFAVRLSRRTAPEAAKEGLKRRFVRAVGQEGHAGGGKDAGLWKIAPTGPGQMKYDAAMATSPDVGERFSSRLAAKADRFVSELLASALENGWRTPEGFLDHFSVEVILEALADEDDLRVRLLVETTGTHEKIAAKKSPTSAAEDVRLALDEGTTTPDVVFGLFDADDWVRLLAAQPMWEFLTDDKFWNADADGSGVFTEALERLCETVHCAIQLHVLREADVVQGVGFERLVQRLEESQLRDIVVSALEAGARQEPFNVSSLLDVVSLEGIIEQATLGRAWNDVVVRFVEEPLGLGTGATAGRRSDRPPVEAEPRPRQRERKSNGAREPKRKRSSRAPEPVAADAVREAPRAEARALTPPESARRRASTSPPRQSAPPPHASSAPPAHAPQASSPQPTRVNSPQPARVSSAPPPRVSSAPPPPSAHVAQHVSMAPVPAPVGRPQSLPPPPPSARGGRAASQAPAPAAQTPSSPPPPNDPSLAQAVARLGRIDRLPARHGEFPGAVIHAIESMYGELATVSDAQQQLAIIRDSFPNDAWRSRAMLALLELLNPGISSASPSIVQESADALSVRLLTEERQLSRQAAQRSARPGTR
jgi:hypothetical protein